MAQKLPKPLTKAEVTKLEKSGAKVYRMHSGEAFASLRDRRIYRAAAKAKSKGGEAVASSA